MVRGAAAVQAADMPDRPGRPCSGSPELMHEIEAVYRRRFTVFHRVASAIAGDPELGRDAVQEGFARAVRHQGDLRDEGALEGWLWKAVVNAAKDQRRARRRVTLTPEPPEPVADAAPTTTDVADTLRARITALPERQRLALFLRYFADLSYTEIGVALGVRTGTVGATLSSAHRALRKAAVHELAA